MKKINTYINERLRLTNKHTYTCKPKDKDELKRIIIERIEKEGNACDLNDIDVSKITDMSNLFDINNNMVFANFNGDISQWDVSNVKDMGRMFWECKKFNCDISQWNVSKVEKMDGMFWCCKNFDCDLSKWNISNVKIINGMFWDCKKFNQDLNSWDVSNIENMWHAFKKCPTTPTWYDRKQFDK